ncbi:hypothetical protein [Emticicia agri]|nr:hypothetical protein [Emticicia agri]
MKTYLLIVFLLLLYEWPLMGQDKPKSMGINELSNAVVMLYQRTNGMGLR